MKILVIFTGGTIGSTLTDGWITPDSSTKYTLLENYKKEYGNDIEFKTCEPYSILSENLSAKALSALVEKVLLSQSEGFDGIIVTHGTDTLQFSAAALAYATGNNCIPTVLVSSNYPLEDPRSNGNTNFKAAVDFIKDGKSKGVYIAYKNAEDVVLFHSALSVLSHLEQDDRVFSLYGKTYAKQTEGGIEILEKSSVCEKLPVKFSDDVDILVVDAHPADSYKYELKNYSAVILRPYHSGTLGTALPAFIEFCKKAKELGTPVYVVNISSETAYASAKTFEELGIIPLNDITFAAAYVKLWMKLS